MKNSKYYIYTIFLFVLSCSFDTTTGVWNYHEKKNVIINNSTILNETISFNNFKNEVIKYSNISDYPIINLK